MTGRRGHEGQAEIWWIPAVEYLLDGKVDAGIIMPSVTGLTVPPDLEQFVNMLYFNLEMKRYLVRP